jgi:hypothetical protein
MSDYIEIMVLVEGKTEEIFVNDLLRPFMAHKKIYIYPTQLSKPGQKGGDVRFSRAQKDIGMHLKQRLDTYVTTFIDFYGTKEWPGLNLVRPGATPAEIAQTINKATKAEVVHLFEITRPTEDLFPMLQCMNLRHCSLAMQICYQPD